MLKGIDPLLSGELLKMLDDMGHGDRLLLVDRNYPAAASGRLVVRLGEVTVVRAIRAILSVFPLDVYADHPLERMEVEDDPAILTDSQAEILEIARAEHGRPLEYAVVPAWTSTRAPGTCSPSSTPSNGSPTAASSCRRASCSTPRRPRPVAERRSLAAST